MKNAPVRLGQWAGATACLGPPASCRRRQQPRVEQQLQQAALAEAAAQQGAGAGGCGCVAVVQACGLQRRRQGGQGSAAQLPL